MSQNTSGFRSKEQVLADLSKAMGFSPAALEANRAGKLLGEQFGQQIGRCLNPLVMGVVFAAAPVLFWTAMAGMRDHVSFASAFNQLIGQFSHLHDMLETQGKMTTFITIGSIIGGMAAGAFFFTRFSPALYFDLLARQVVTREARVVAREEQTMRPNGRDPIEKYYFDAKTNTYPVNLEAYRALESGGLYLMYVLPRSGVLVAVEPKITRITPSPAASTPPQESEQPPAPAQVPTV